MARVRLDIADPANRVTLRAILQADGHEIADDSPDVIFTDRLLPDAAYDRAVPCILLTRAGDIARAVTVMRRDAFGYILMPFQPGEAAIALQRALEWRGSARDAEGTPSQTEPASTRIEDAESQLILAALRRCKNSQTEAARMLGIGRNTLWRKLKRIRKSAMDAQVPSD